MPNAAGQPVVFVSYSHDTPEHKEAVLALSQRLREDGLDARIDQYVKGSPEEKWPRWMLNQIDDAKYVIAICTATYYRRFRGKDAPGKGKGADWEGAVITQEIYDSNSKTKKFIPVFLSTISEKDVPEPLRGHTYYCLEDDKGFKALCDALWDQAGVEPAPLGKQRIAAATPPAPTQATVQLVAPSFPVTTPQAPSALPQSSPTSPGPQANAHTQLPMHRRSDQAFVAHAKKEMADVLERCQVLKKEIDKLITAQGDGDLVDRLDAGEPLETVVNDFLRPATIASLEGLPQDGNEFKKRWETAKEVLAWLAVLSVKGSWVEELERARHGFAGIYFEIPVVTELGVEIVSSRYRQCKTTFPADVTRSDLPGAGSFKAPLMPLSYVLQKELDTLLLEIWNQVFSSDSRSELAARDLARLNAELGTRTKNRTAHHYLAFWPEDKTPLTDSEFLAALLRSLPNLTVICMKTPQGYCPLLVDDENVMLSDIRSFLQLPLHLSSQEISA